MIQKIVVQNYRTFQHLELAFDAGMNIVVGDNDAGKSTLLEAINLALTARRHGKPLAQDISPYVFNQEITRQYLAALQEGGRPTPPEIIIDLFLDDREECAGLVGTNNLLGEDAPGVRLRVGLDPDYTDEYNKCIQSPESISVIPTEYYTVDWLSFSGNGVTSRSIPATASLIDASAIKLRSGADYYLHNIIENHLDKVERVELARAYRTLRQDFAGLESIAAINGKLAGTHGHLTERDFSLSIDISQQSSLENSLVPHLDDLPFQYVGNGEQNSLKILLALARKAEDAHAVLVEEPENHLSFSSLNVLVAKIAEKCRGRQVIVATHSSYVLNKLGLENLILLSRDDVTKMGDLPSSTVDYFNKLSGYDTLRLVLAKRSILVEGPSDELVVQRAYLDRHARLPIQDGIDVINVRGLSAKRLLDIAVPLRKRVTVITDNDGDYAAAEARYAEHLRHDFIDVCIGRGDEYRTLETQLVAAAGRESLNRVLGKSYATDEELIAHMTKPYNKTTCALAIFESQEQINMPGYITDAIA
jgi:ABC-type cobalamin/Fe3+-siderophores transport system ATPase subunit